MASSQPRLTQGPVGRQLITMAVPVLFGVATMMLQNFVDMWFIGRVGVRELAALSFAFPVLMVVTSVAIGLGAGTSSVVARAIGSDNHRRAKRLSTDSLLLSFGITVVICAVGIATITPLFRLLGAPDELIPLIAGYMKILYVGVPFVVVGMVGMSSMRATGDTRLPSMLMVVTAIINVILDPILIFGIGPVPAMGLNGAAMAALIARGVIFAGTLYLMHKRLDLLTFKKPDRDELVRSWKDILHVGIPAAGTNAIIPIATGVITAMLAKYGPETVAGFGVASRVESLVLVMFYALSAVIGPFVGQNISANRPDRIFRALWLCTAFCLGSGLVIALLLALSGDFVPSLFSDHAEVTDVGTLFLMIVPISYGAYGMVMVMNASFNGMGKPMPAVHVSVGRMMLIYVPLAMITEKYFGITGVFVSYAVANIITGALSYVWARASVEEQCNRHGAPVVVSETI
ncbi:MAG: MATE family efflux transporter [Proteobacteria bacterium]|nr:MATE family efflux transporter [Pseudomonadota bacterium]MDA0992209.1 MATE family efflux transporter [Pseudomonadota bacterium]